MTRAITRPCGNATEIQCMQGVRISDGIIKARPASDACGYSLPPSDLRSLQFHQRVMLADMQDWVLVHARRIADDLPADGGSTR